MCSWFWMKYRELKTKLFLSNVWMNRILSFNHQRIQFRISISISMIDLEIRNDWQVIIHGKWKFRRSHSPMKLTPPLLGGSIVIKILNLIFNFFKSNVQIGSLFKLIIWIVKSKRIQSLIKYVKFSFRI